MDDNFKKKLHLIFDFIEIQGCQKAELSADYYSLNIYDTKSIYCMTNKNYIKLKLPIPIINDLEILLNENKNYFDYFSDDAYEYDIILDPTKRVIEVYEKWIEYEQGDSESFTLSSEIDMEVKDVIKSICEKDEICRGEITFDFYGGGDSGYIESMGTSDFDGEYQLPAIAEDIFYRILNDSSYGWEINEGSSGNCVIDMDLEELKVNINHILEVNKRKVAFTYNID